MPPRPGTLHEHLRDRLAASFRQLERALDGVDDAMARAGVDPNWTRSRRGAGLDGSVAGIVHHVAAWKAISAAGLETGRFPGQAEVAPGTPGWEGLLSWLRESHARLAAALAALTDAGLERVVTFDGEEMSLALVFTHLLEHDQYHAGQVNLLRQLRGQADERKS
jgi:hypothetical protein